MNQVDCLRLVDSNQIEKLGNAIIMDSKRIKKNNKKKVQKLIKKAFEFILPRTIDVQHRYLIRGDIIIDIDKIKKNNIQTWSCLDLKDYMPTKSVKYLKENKFFQIEFGRVENPIRDFTFIIGMLKTLGDTKINYLAETLQEYKNVYDLIDQILANNRIMQLNDQEAQQAVNSNICTLYRPQYEGEWTYEQSLQKASYILKSKIQENKFYFYSILKGNYDQYEVVIHGVCENAIKLIFGNLDNAEITKILLENGLVIMNRSILEQIMNRTQANRIHLSGIQQDIEYSTFKKDITSYSINNYLFKLSLNLERFKLSNYKDRFNDYLVIGQINDDQILNLANQMFIQKVFLNNGTEETEILSNIGYSASSEYFIEKFYPPEEEQKSQERIKMLKQINQIQNTTNKKQCGYRILNLE
ncbi:hypothetical protein TTHERM_01253350 (macronuclear) [Tetrahymena thermophila SB210]|uniref:Uncharacterized protein n=1 Tax=Tetrahymena thermophila (strain SB210) TaxID=312017 RepID=Q22V95_TETTS|nr:hypothetical protein TTHERM_01253350 [Tetrahymena thermophila SB210]EAR89190.1 hypothetical protein TTHERM_01253350 [Tetrahymena thermophila SB210]|eukprot:XP_001009435.1 hypothetical protein TTHERM_01253350 [Tetrahymena thermophila SB210]